MRESQGYICILLGQQEGHAFVFVDRFHDFENLFNQLRGQPHGRFIQQDRFRSRHKCTTNGRHLLFTARRISCL